MSCCPTAPSVEVTEFDPDEPTAGPEVERQPGESEACFARRAGNVSETGQVDDKTEPVPDKIQQTSIVPNGSSTAVTIDMTFTTNGPTPVTSWTFTPASFTGGVTTNTTTGKFSGTFDASLHGQKLNLRVVANGASGVIDDRSYDFSPQVFKEGDSVRLQHPLPGSIITSKFGPRRPPAQGASSQHLALDFAYAGGVTKDVMCAADGEVVLARPGSGYGNYVMVKHSNGSGQHLCTTLYAHLDSIYVKVGQKVAGGQPLGKEGNTGIGSGAHLHFEVRLPNNTRVDPTPYLSGGATLANAVSTDNQPVAGAGTSQAAGGAALTPSQVEANSSCPPFGPSYGDAPSTPPAVPPAPTSDDPFELAWFFVLTEEVNSKWASSPDRTPVMLNPAGNQAIDDGLIETKDQRQRVGFVDHAKDPGGVTKFGVAQKFNPKVDVKTATYADARSTAYNIYWLSPVRPCNTLSKQIAAFVFDCNYLFGAGGSKQIFNESGITGTETGAEAEAAVDKLLKARYARIDSRSPALLATFGKGWRARAERAAAYAKSLK